MTMRLRSLPAVLGALTIAATLIAILGATPASAQTRPKQPAAKAKRTAVVDRVVAVVNDTVVLDSELRARLTPLVGDVQGIADARERRRRFDKLRTQMLDEMVNEELIVQAAEEARIEIESSEVDAAVDEIKKQNNLDDTGLAQALQQQGYSLSAYKTDLRRQLLRLRAVNQLVRPRVTVTDEDIRARYDAMQRRSEAVSAVQLAHILIRVPEKASEQDIAAARDRAATAIQRVKGGEEFAKVAADVSEDVATKGGGGELGWFERGSISPEWEAVVFSMDKGEVRGPVSGPQGLHVFFVQEVKRTDLKSFDDLKEQLRAELTRREMDKQTTQWIEELRKKAYVDLKS
jgi:peptidyl-prolyl cis-trans isomerase SurA